MNDREKQIDELAGHIKAAGLPLYITSADCEILADVLYMLGYRKEQAENDDEGIYLIIPASLPGYHNPLGYIKGTEEKAKEYCRKYNEKQKHGITKIKAEELSDLEFLLRVHLSAEDHPAIIDRETWEAAQAKIKEQNEREGGQE